MTYVGLVLYMDNIEEPLETIIASNKRRKKVCEEINVFNLDTREKEVL